VFINYCISSASLGSHLDLNTLSNQLRLKRILKKFQIKTILKIPGHVALDRVDIWLQDEARFGQQNTATRLWTVKGSRPRAVKQQQFEYAYLFGSVYITNGASEALVVPYVNRDITIKQRIRTSISLNHNINNKIALKFKLLSESTLSITKYDRNESQ
jgi:hypothetical protein